MDSRLLNWLFGLIAIIGVSAAVYFGISETGAPQVAVTATPTIEPSAAVTASPTPAPSTSPTSTTTRTFTEAQALSLPNLVESIKEGGSLIAIAEQYTLNLNHLAWINNITDPNVVYAGQNIIVPDDATKPVYTILFVLNEKRLAREKAKVEGGTQSLYQDPVTAFLSDSKGIYGITGETPLSKSNETATAVTLATTDDSRSLTAQMEKDASGLWLTKRLTIKVLVKEEE